jgi:hypothetical protein
MLQAESADIWEDGTTGRRRCHWPSTLSTGLLEATRPILMKRFCFSGRTGIGCCSFGSFACSEQVPFDDRQSLETPLSLRRRLRPHGGMMTSLRRSFTNRSEGQTLLGVASRTRGVGVLHLKSLRGARVRARRPFYRDSSRFSWGDVVQRPHEKQYQPDSRYQPPLET